MDVEFDTVFSDGIGSVPFECVFVGFWVDSGLWFWLDDFEGAELIRLQLGLILGLLGESDEVRGL